jgi:hypothetical protein
MGDMLHTSYIHLRLDESSREVYEYLSIDM